MRHESLHNDSLLNGLIPTKKKNRLMRSSYNLYVEAVFSCDSLLLIDRSIDYQYCQAKVGLK